jgi:predicted enzyme related to lactoylglutathione lyase
MQPDRQDAIAGRARAHRRRHLEGRVVATSKGNRSNRRRAVASTAQLIGQVDFVGVPTRDLEAAVAFYGESLGLPRSVYIPERGYAEFETANVTLSVYNPTQMGMEHHANPNPFALHVDDVAQARETLEARGVQFQGEILDTGVCHMAFFADRDGNAMMLHHRYAPRA